MELTFPKCLDFYVHKYWSCWFISKACVDSTSTILFWVPPIHPIEAAIVSAHCALWQGQTKSLGKLQFWNKSSERCLSSTENQLNPVQWRLNKALFCIPWRLLTRLWPRITSYAVSLQWETQMFAPESDEFFLENCWKPILWISLSTQPAPQVLPSRFKVFDIAPMGRYAFETF